MNTVDKRWWPVLALVVAFFILAPILRLVLPLFPDVWAWAEPALACGGVAIVAGALLIVALTRK